MKKKRQTCNVDFNLSKTLAESSESSNLCGSREARSNYPLTETVHDQGTNLDTDSLDNENKANESPDSCESQDVAEADFSNQDQCEDDKMAVDDQCTAEVESRIDDEADQIQENRSVEVMNYATPKRKRRNKAQTFIKQEMGKRYTAKELVGHSFNGGERMVDGKMVQKIALTPKRKFDILQKALALYPDDYNNLKDPKQVINEKCRKTSLKKNDF